jgi:hypothetical protein
MGCLITLFGLALLLLFPLFPPFALFGIVVILLGIFAEVASHGRRSERIAREQFEAQNGEIAVLRRAVTLETDPAKQAVLEAKLDAVEVEARRRAQRRLIAYGVLAVILILAIAGPHRSTDRAAATTPEPTPTPALEAHPPAAAETSSIASPSPVPRAELVLSPAATPAAPALESTEPSPTPEPYRFIKGISRILDAHDWEALTRYTVDGKVNYFGHRHCSNAFIRQDMMEDAYKYPRNRTTYYPDSFTRTVGADGVTYDEVNLYVENWERNGHHHVALARLTVGYTVPDHGPVQIYALVLKVLQPGLKKGDSPGVSLGSSD